MLNNPILLHRCTEQANPRDENLTDFLNYRRALDSQLSSRSAISGRPGGMKGRHFCGWTVCEGGEELNSFMVVGTQVRAFE